MKYLVGAILILSFVRPASADRPGLNRKCLSLATQLMANVSLDSERKRLFPELLENAEEVIKENHLVERDLLDIVVGMQVSQLPVASDQGPRVARLLENVVLSDACTDSVLAETARYLHAGLISKDAASREGVNRLWEIIRVHKQLGPETIALLPNERMPGNGIRYRRGHRGGM